MTTEYAIIHMINQRICTEWLKVHIQFNGLTPVLVRGQHYASLTISPLKLLFLWRKRPCLCVSILFFAPLRCGGNWQA